MFKNWFRKKQKEESISSTEQILEKGERILGREDSNSFYKIIRDVSDDVSSKLEASTISLWIGELFMHYWNDATIEDRNNPEWQNQGLYFWLANEDFPNKSLPPVFEKMNKKFFRITNTVQTFKGTVIPWFGMPGGGLKMGFGNSNNPTPIKDIEELGYIEYVEIIELSAQNLEILNNRENYTLLANTHIKFENNEFYLDGKPITLTQAYSIGVINIAKII